MSAKATSILSIRADLSGLCAARAETIASPRFEPVAETLVFGAADVLIWLLRLDNRKVVGAACPRRDNAQIRKIEG